MSVRHDRLGDVVVLTLDRPESLNALDDEVMQDLLRQFEQISGDASVGAVVLTGAGRAFTAGGELSMLADRVRQVDGDALTPVATQIARTMRDNASVVERIRALHCPTVAAVNGACVGAGLALVAACDLRLSSSRAFFDTAYLNIGLGTDFGVSWLLHELLGASVATDWLLRPRRVTAVEALNHGFVSEVVDDESANTVLDTALALAETLVQAKAGVRALRNNLRDARSDVALGTALDGEVRRFVDTLADAETARRVTAAGSVSSRAR